MDYLCTKTAGTCYSVKVRIGIFWHVIIEYNIHAFNIHATSEEIRRHQDTLQTMMLSFFAYPFLFLIDTLYRRGAYCFRQSDPHRRVTDPRRVTWTRSVFTFWKSLNCWYLDNLSSCVIPRWIPMAGKFCSVNSWAKAMHLCTDFTNMTTYAESNQTWIANVSDIYKLYGFL